MPGRAKRRRSPTHCRDWVEPIEHRRVPCIDGMRRPPPPPPSVSRRRRAARLGHWLRIANGKIANYQVVTPTCWNASPRDASGKRGPIEEALIGTPVIDVVQPIEVLRVIHSFDPCLSCAVHVMRPAEGAKIFHLGHYRA